MEGRREELEGQVVEGGGREGWWGRERGGVRKEGYAGWASAVATPEKSFVS